MLNKPARTVCIALAVMFMTMFFTQTVRPNDNDMLQQDFLMHPIGEVKKSEHQVKIIIEKQYEPGLLGLHAFSHIYVLYWFDRNDTPRKRSVLTVYPRGNRQNPLSGVFATRSPARPNLIALSVCKIISITGNEILVDKIDALPGSPVLDIKPYIPRIDSIEVTSLPEWIDGSR